VIQGEKKRRKRGGRQESATKKRTTSEGGYTKKGWDRLPKIEESQEASIKKKKIKASTKEGQRKNMNRMSIERKSNL